MSHVLIIGFMGAGKSKVGAELARRRGLAFVDLDREIERTAGKSVSELFERDGEDAFREIEHQVLESLAEVPDSIVACGGGIILRDENRALLGRLGRVLYLAVSADEALARIGDTTGRPLLAGDAASLAPKILEARLSLYRSVADITVDTNGLDVEEVLAEAIEMLDSPVSTTVRVETRPAYEVRIGHGLLAGLGQVFVELVGARECVVVSDANVSPLYLERVLGSLRQCGVAAQGIVVDAGEESKCWSGAGVVLEGLSAARLGRDGAVVALGGGVVGDLAGFAAAVYLRGVPVVQVPTTLLAQVDSSVGGKTGVDLTAGKNLAGAFWQPTLVVSDTSLLHTLPDAEWSNGLVEVTKTALLSGESDTATLERDAHRLLVRDDVAVLETVTACVRFKASIVSADERESGRRECLNYGHTLGHALEKVIGYGEISHGAAVAVGMRFAARLAEVALGVPHDVTRRIGALLDSLGVAVEGLGDVDPEALIEAMGSDKKTRAGALRFVLLRSPGVWEVVSPGTDMVRTELGRALRGE